MWHISVKMLKIIDLSILSEAHQAVNFKYLRISYYIPYFKGPFCRTHQLSIRLHNYVDDCTKNQNMHTFYGQVTFKQLFNLNKYSIIVYKYKRLCIFNDNKQIEIYRFQQSRNRNLIGNFNELCDVWICNETTNWTYLFWIHATVKCSLMHHK